MKKNSLKKCLKCNEKKTVRGMSAQQIHKGYISKRDKTFLIDIIETLKPFGCLTSRVFFLFKVIFGQNGNILKFENHFIFSGKLPLILHSQILSMQNTLSLDRINLIKYIFNHNLKSFPHKK